MRFGGLRKKNKTIKESKKIILKLKQKHLILVVSLAIINLVSAVAFYIYNFHGSLSSNSSDWNNFSGFLSLFVNVCSLLLIGYVSFLTYSINKIATNTALESLNIQNTPVLDVLTENSINFNHLNADSSFLICLSNAAARNIHIRLFIDDGLGEIKTFWVLMNGLIGNSKYEITWLQQYSKFEICYTDAMATRGFLYQNNTIRGQHFEIELELFTRMTREEGFVKTIDEVNALFKEFVYDDWNSIDPNLHQFRQFVSLIENDDDDDDDEQEI